MCRKCLHVTSHRSIASGQLGDQSKKLYQTFSVESCHECRTTTYCIDSKMNPGAGIGDSSTILTTYHPPLIRRLKPDWFESLKNESQKVLSEVYSAIDNKLYFLASSGTRTAIDQLIFEKIGNVGTFKGKIKKLVEEQIIDCDESEMLLAVIDAGSASSHRNFRPDDDTINHMMDILETVFYKLLVEPVRKEELKEKAKELRKVTPSRKQA